jgi:hypothetical protein
MRRRQRRKIKHLSQNFDSFLDTMTNTIGVLMFITLFTTLIAEKGNSIVRTPLAKPVEKTPRFFEIRDNKITYINDEQVGAEIEQLVGNLPACNQPSLSSGASLSGTQDYLDYRSCIQSRANRLINFQTQTDYYQVTMVNASTFSLLYEPIPTKLGESKEELKASGSDFQQTLAKLNPSQDYLAFIVRPNSFSTFRVAREQAWQQGFNVGWEPHKTDAPIIFGSGGRAIDAQ